MKIKVIIPARLDSKRFPKKILADIKGRPLLWWTWRRALKLADSKDVIVAVDDIRVKTLMEGYGANTVLTPRSCRNGTERIVAAAGKTNADVLVNVQADEPVFSINGVKRLIDLFKKRNNADFATLAAPIFSLKDINDPNVVKVVTGAAGRALYFSRSVIPFCRQKAELPGMLRKGVFLKHIGIYAYRKNILLKAVRLKSPAIEGSEKLEQLKYLYHGFRIDVLKGDYDSVGVDVPGDLGRVAKMLK